MFTKIARVPIIALAEGRFDTGADRLSFKRLASVRTASFYQEHAQQLDIKTALALTASEYNISSDPQDYIFEAVRAVTAEVPNENGDAFPKNELLRFDHRLGKAIYQTFIGKPHQVNHRAENPKTARGVVLDASYNDLSPALENCPACNHRTASPEGRDSTGINCVKCGTVVKDEFVELLLAIDTRKDPTFAEGVRTGALDSLSMGCEAGYTDCSICDNRARSAAQFCEHIRGGNKKKSFKTASGQERMAFEKCGDVVFTEISRVDQPADPKAKQQEVLRVAGLPLAVESEMLIMNARLAKLEQMSKSAQVQSNDPEVVPQVPFKNIAESIRWAETSIHKLKAEVHRLTSEKGNKQREAAESSRPFYAWESAAYDAQIKANRQFVSRLEDYVAKAREMQAAGTPWEKGLTRQMSRFFASKEGQALDGIRQETDQLEQLKVMHPEMAPQIDQLSEQNNVPEPMSIDDYAKEHEKSFDQNMTLGEMGMKPDEQSGLALPVNVSAGKAIDEKIAADLDALMDTVKENNVGATQNFANSYQHLEATVTSTGNVKVHTAAGTLFVVRPTNRPTTKDAAAQVAREVLASIASDGLVGAVAKYDAIVGPKAAQVLEHHLEDFAGGRDKGDTKGMPEGGLVDHQDGRSKPEKSMVGEEHTDRKDETREKRDQAKSDVLEKHQPDHKEPLPSGLTPMTDKENSDMADGHGKPSKTTLKQIMVDFKDKQPKSASKQGQASPDDMPLPDGGMANPDEGLCPIPCPKCGSHEIDNSGDMETLQCLVCKNVWAPTPEEMDVLNKMDVSNHAVKELPDSSGHKTSMDVCANEMCSMHPGKKEAGGDCGCAPNCGCQCGCKCAETHEAQGAPDATQPAPGQQSPVQQPGVQQPGMTAPPAQPMMPMASKQVGLDDGAKKYVSRIERLYQNRLAQAEVTAKDRFNKVRSVAVKDVTARILRAMRLVAKRQQLNLEESAIKGAMFDVLTRQADLDADTFYPGMDEGTAAHIVEATSNEGLDKFIESLLKRASEFIDMNEEAFVALENDVKHLRPMAVRVQASTPRVASRQDIRKQAENGNLVIAPTASEPSIPSNESRSTIRSALGSTKVSRTSKFVSNKG